MSNDCVGATLEECSVCGVVGVPERIAAHDCVASEGRTATHQRYSSHTEATHTGEDEDTTPDSVNEGSASQPGRTPKGER